MKCPKCEAEVGKDDHFCGECGAELKGEVEEKPVKPETIPVKADISPGSGENIKGLLCYSFTWISGVIFLLTENKSKFVRFHAIQSIAVFILLSILISLCEFFFLSYDYYYYSFGDIAIYVLLNQHPLIPMYLFFNEPFSPAVLLYMSILYFVIWIFLMYQAYRGKKYKLPIVGNLAEKYS